ncbi:hypothetical protein [Streptomyces sp. NPDC048392]|uniref:hypothetical protein n=1 Tax=Streptomyces sp. NPDC048392 TaxID=3365543 RepID=UPI0037202C42
MNAPRYDRPSAQTQRLVKEMLGEIADRLDANRPNALMTTIGRHALLQAATMDPPLLRALRDVAPEIDHTVPRREYAAELRQIAGGM